jgi:urea transporter
MNASLATLSQGNGPSLPVQQSSGPRARTTAPPPGTPLAHHLAFVADAVLHAYSQVIFAHSRPIGLLLLLASMVVPDVGLVGLMGVMLAGSLAVLLQLDRESVRNGVLGYNALLVFLAIGAMMDRSPAFWMLAAITAMTVVLFHVALSGALAWHFRLPVLSVPFVLTTWTVMAAAPHIRGMGFHGHPPALDLGPFPGPVPLDDLLRSLGAIFFQPHWTAGLLVLLALLAYSRIATVHALVGFAVAIFADEVLFTFPAGYLHLYIGFNFIVTAVALGGIYYVPSAASLLLAAGGALATGLLSVGMLTMLQPVGLPVLAAPFNLCLLVMLYALGQRTRDKSPRPVDFMAGSPEANLDWYRTRIRRFQGSMPVRLQLPFRGTWICTQGNDGEHTHQGLWRHGLDFEVADLEGRRTRGTGEHLTDFLCYRLPVVAAAPGTVVRVVDGIPDNAVGDVNTRDNWGNLVIVQHGPELYSMVAHLSPGTIVVSEGQAVVAGERLGLCGSSGRSPLPHLHFQLQPSPVVGDRTLLVSFESVAVQHTDLARVHHHHTPQEGERCRSIVRVPDVAAAFALPAGRRHHFEVEEGGKTHTAELISEIDLLGNRSLHEPATGARLWFDDRGDHFVVYDHTGPRRGVLLAMYCALARVPLDDEAELAWSDILAPHRHTWSLRGWLLDGLAAFFTPQDQRIDYRLTARAGGRTVSGRSRPLRGVPEVRTEAQLHPVDGLVEVSVQIGERTVRARRMRERA